MITGIAPSILNADFAHLANEIHSVEEKGVNSLHLDVMDGQFVPNITFGPPIVAAANDLTDLPLDVHLMIERPEQQIASFVQAGADHITIHAEACRHLHYVIQLIKSYDVTVGVALNPATPLHAIEHVLEDIDMILIMTVNPGFGGSAFIPRTVEKVKQAQVMTAEVSHDIAIEVDGGINDQTIATCAQAGADIFVVGSYIYKSSDRSETIRHLNGYLSS